MSKVVFNKVTITNFMSFGNVPTTITLDNDATFGVIGDNRDIGGDGGSKNGVGKSSGFSAVIYAAFGKSIDKLKADDFINITNGKKMIVELEFSKNGIDYTIKRGRKPNFLSFHATVDGETTDLTRDSMSNTDVDIEKTLGMSYDVFMSTIFLSPHREAFYEMGAPAQRNIIEQMLSLDVLTDRAETLKSLRTDLTVDIKVKGKEIDLYETHVEQWSIRKERLSGSTTRWDEEKTATIARMSDELAKLREVPVDVISSLITKGDECKEAHREVSGALQVRKNDLSEIKKHNQQWEIIKNDINLLIEQEQKAEIEHELELSTIETSLEEIGDVSTFGGYVESHRAWKRLQRELRELERDLIDITGEISRGESDILKYTTEIEAIKDGMCPTCGGHYEDDAKLTKSESALKRTTVAVKTATEQLPIVSESVANTKKRIDEIDEVVKSLTDDDVVGLESDIAAVNALQARRDNLLTATKRDYGKEIGVLTERLEALGDVFSDDEIEGVELELMEANTALDELSTELEAIETELIKYNIRTLVELSGIKSKIDNLVSNIKEKEKEKNPHLPELEQHINEQPESNEVLMDELNVLNEKVTHANYLIKLLTDSKSFVRRGILDRYIPFLNQKINGYLQEIGLPHVVEVSTDLNVELHYMGKNVSYYNLSRGERLRLNIATTLAFRNLMEMIGKCSNLLLVDEVLDSGLDEAGIISTASLLKSSADDVFIITHRSELMDTLDRRLTVIKENGFARIELK